MITAEQAANLAISSPNASDLMVLLAKKIIGAATNGQSQFVFMLPSGVGIETAALSMTTELQSLGYIVENNTSYLIVKW